MSDEVTVPIPIEEIKEIVLCLYDAAVRLDFKGVSSIQMRLEKMKEITGLWHDDKLKKIRDEFASSC